MPHIVKGVRRHRYIAFDVACEDQYHLISKSDLIQALRQHTANLFSKNGKDLALWVVRFNGTQGIVKCHYMEKDHVRNLLESLKKIGTTQVSITTRVTSGTIHGLVEKTHRFH